MNKYFFLLVIILSSNLYSQWSWQNPTPQGNKIYTLNFVTPALGYAGTEDGTIMKTYDGGNTWTVIASNLGIGFTGIYFLNTTTGIAVGGIGSTGTIARTTDGGITWSTQSLGQFNGLKCVTFVNTNTGYAGSYSGIIFVTTNSGMNWTSQSNNMSIINELCFVSITTGYAAASDKIYKTTNGGTNWLEVYTTHFGAVNSISFRDSNTVIASGVLGKILRTTNAGNTWDSIYSGVNTTLNSVCFINQNTAFATGGGGGIENSTILCSTNGGINWFTQESSTTDELLVIEKRDSSTAFIAGAYGRILKYNSNGSNWISISNGFPDGMHDIAFINSDFIYAIGNGIYQPGKLIKTTNGGINWNTFNINTYNTLTSLSFINANTGWAAGYQSTLYRTTNGGLNWENQGQSWSPALYIFDVFFLNSNTGSIIGSSSRIYKTTDGGFSWTQQNSNGAASLYRMYYVNLNTGYIGSDGTYIKTTNGGDLWTLYPQLPGIYIIRDIFFLNELTGWATGNRIYKTTNGGNNWVQQLIPTNTVNSVHFINENTGYIAGAEGLIYSTTNGGNNWYQQISGTRRWLTGVCFADQYEGWIVGFNGVILHTTNGGFVKVENVSKETPRYFSLSQNYPNPFNPVTKIKFQIPATPLSSIGEGSGVRLVIYDILGREVTTLVNEQLQPGTYEVEWDPEKSGQAGLSSGVYFYKLIIDEYIESKKMILIK